VALNRDCMNLGGKFVRAFIVCYTYHSIDSTCSLFSLHIFRRAPEEMIIYNDNTTAVDASSSPNDIYPKQPLSEKVDIYSLGNTLYVLLTGSEPLGKEHKQRRLKNVSNLLANGKYPVTFPDEYENSSNVAIVALRDAIRSCWQLDPNKRPAAIDIANGLFMKLETIWNDENVNSTTLT